MTSAIQLTQYEIVLVSGSPISILGMKIKQDQSNKVIFKNKLLNDPIYEKVSSTALN